VRPTDEEFRARLHDVLERSGLSMRGLSSAMGRDPGYVAAWLDPSRPSRARPTPQDLLRASDATGIEFVDLLESLWGIERARFADELARLGVAGPLDERFATLTAAERSSVADYVDYLAARHPRAADR
jgi:transcriptional regulator with XRE-family HTH domain